MTTPKIVLVVDDNTMVQSFVKQVLTPLGYQVEVCGDGVAALERVQASPVDLILVDLVLPRMNGYRFCRALEKKNLQAHTKVIILTPGQSKMALQVVERSCAVDCLSKPVTIKALLQVMERHLALHDEATAAKATKPARAGLKPTNLSETSDERISSYQDLQSWLRDRLQNAMGMGLSARLDKLVGSASFEDMLNIVLEVLDDSISEELVDQAIERIRSSPHTEP